MSESVARELVVKAREDVFAASRALQTATHANAKVRAEKIAEAVTSLNAAIERLGLVAEQPS